LGSSICSDSLVEEAAGVESAAKSFKEREEKGFRESEVIAWTLKLIYNFLLLLLY
jgi:hypothetical protein